MLTVFIVVGSICLYLTPGIILGAKVCKSYMILHCKGQKARYSSLYGSRKPEDYLGEGIFVGSLASLFWPVAIVPLLVYLRYVTDEKIAFEREHERV